MAEYGKHNVKPYQMGTYHMANDNAFEPQRSNNFEVQITGLGEDGKTITLSVDSFDAPNITQNPIEVPYGNNKIKFAGTPSFADSSITTTDFIGKDVEKVLSNWQKLSYDYSTQKIGWAKDYKKTAYLIKYDPSGGTPRSWVLVGCWLSALNLGSFAQGNSEVRKINCTLTYDYAIPDEYATKSTYFQDQSENWSSNGQ